ncbi:MAG: DUF4065 domain-containing protein [Betaproteobacteria bacterium]|nr:DUF4065 domain-containing protein [Betaproteobacteria bacterium]
METFEQQGHDSVAVANRFIATAHKQGAPIFSLAQLIRMIYIAHGFHLAFQDTNLIKDEVQAWPQGPVIPRVYETFLRIPPVSHPLPAKPDVQDEMDLDPYALGLIELIYQGYGHMNYAQIAELMRQRGTPWDLVYKSKGNRATIEPELTREYYHALIENRRKKAQALQHLEAAL